MGPRGRQIGNLDLGLLGGWVLQSPSLLGRDLTGLDGGAQGLGLLALPLELPAGQQRLLTRQDRLTLGFALGLPHGPARTAPT